MHPVHSLFRTLRAWPRASALGAVAAGAFAVGIALFLGMPCREARAAATDQPPTPPPAPVEIATARLQAVAPRTWIPGSIVSRDDARVASVVSGRVLAIADVGTRVAAGERLAKLDDTPLRHRLADLEAQVARARAQQTLAKTQLERYDRLAQTNVLSASQLDEARAQVDVAGQDVARLTAQLRQAEYEIAQSEVRAPFDGIVTERFAQRGEYLDVGAALVRLVNTAQTEARATAALTLAANVRAGQQVQLRAGPVTRAARVRTVVPVGDDRSRQFEIRVVLADAPREAAWLVGTPVDISLPSGVERTALVVPRDALVLRADRAYVLRVTAGGTVEELPVEPGTAIADAVEVRGALAAGDRLVVRGGERLAGGQAVKVLAAAAGARNDGGPRAPERG